MEGPNCTRALGFDPSFVAMIVATIDA